VVSKKTNPSLKEIMREGAPDPGKTRNRIKFLQNLRNVGGEELGGRREWDSLLRYL
jgi:hypothetical protein